MTSSVVSDTYLSDANSFPSNVITGFNASGIGLTVAVLLAFAYVAWHPTSRHHMNRVSLRLLVYALIASLLYATMFISSLAFHRASAACTFVGFAANTALLFSAAMFFCVSLNLQLVLVHRINGQMMEKYYLIGSSLLCAICNITPLAAGQIGYFPAGDICWYTNNDDAAHFRWVIGTYSSWALIMAIGEVISCLVVVSFMIRTQSCATRALLNATGGSTLSSPPPIVQYRGIILRIGLYPFLSCLINFSTVTFDMYLTVHTDATVTIYRMSVADACLHGFRGCIYALLCATDPSFLRAVHALCSHSTDASQGSTSTHTRSKRFSMGSKALVRVDFEREVDRPSGDTHGESGDVRGESRDEGSREPKCLPEADLESRALDTESQSGDGIACQL
ncbi:hypothetical protein C8R43DRAFT_1116833 [Mycena crocata]|nr:hypothetical protein C8R43DRAFT_1116833 [Mycena crocata]